MDQSGQMTLDNEALKVTQISVQKSDTESLLSSRIQELKKTMGESVLVVGVHVPKSGEAAI